MMIAIAVTVAILYVLVVLAVLYTYRALINHKQAIEDQRDLIEYMIEIVEVENDDERILQKTKPGEDIH